MKKGTISIYIGICLFVAGLLLTSYNIYDNYRAGKAAESILEKLILLIKDDPIPAEGRYYKGANGFLTSEIEYPDYILNPDMDMPVVKIDGEYYIGILTIPAINIELPVFEEWSYPHLKMSPCRYSGTCYKNNMVICAHNYDIHFGELNSLRYDDVVKFVDVDGNIFNYKVVEIITLEPTEIDNMVMSDYDLTLFTCNLTSSLRVTIRCEKIGNLN